MAQRTKRQRQVLSRDFVKELKLELDCFNEEKEKETYGLRDLVRDLQPQIKTALSNNWSWKEIAETLGKKGVQVAPDTLQQYYRDEVKNNGSTLGRKPFKPKPNSTQVEPQHLEIKEASDWDEEDESQELESNNESLTQTSQSAKFNEFDLSKV
jgi:hypothetical protein